MQSNIQEPNSADAFVSYYISYLCNLQTTNNELLKTILQKNQSSLFFRDRSISLLTSYNGTSEEKEYISVDEFRQKAPLTTYNDYRDYMDRMIFGEEKNLLSLEKIIYFSTSSGTTGKMKYLPVIAETMKNIGESTKLAMAIICRSLPASSLLSSRQRVFSLQSGKKSGLFQRAKDGTPIGPLSQSFSALSTMPRNRSLLSTDNTLTLDIVEKINDFDSNAFVQLVFALVAPNLYSYSTSLATIFIHTVKLIENYFEEMSLCISSANFEHSSLLRKHSIDSQLLAQLNQTLIDITSECGGASYRMERAQYIRNECLKINVPGILHRLWPSLLYASTAIGSTFSMYKEEVEFYCGEHLPLINMMIYISSEGPLGALASIHTDEYFLLPTCAFFEFIKEEDIQQDQPKTLLISEIQPDHRYELVCTTAAGLVRYRMGDVVTCTRFLSRSDDLVPLSTKPEEIPRIPLVSLAYRVGSLLDAFGEKTTEQHVMNALLETTRQWKEQGICVDICDFASYPKLDVFPTKYVIFLELIINEGHEFEEQQLRLLNDTMSSKVEQQLCKANQFYKEYRDASKLDSVTCILVRRGTFLAFMRQVLSTSSVSPTQFKPHRLLKNEHDIKFFYDNLINMSSS